MTFCLDNSKETVANLNRVRAFVYDALFYRGFNLTVAKLKNLFGCSLDDIDEGDKEIGWDVDGLFAFDISAYAFTESTMIVKIFPDPKKLDQ